MDTIILRGSEDYYLYDYDLVKFDLERVHS